jgi:glycogen synthase
MGDEGDAMQIGLISREYPPFFGGGIGSYTVRWSRALAAAGHRVVVITVSGEGREERDRDGEVTVIRLPFIKGIAHGGDWSGPHPAISTPTTRAAFAAFSPVAVFSMQIAGAIERIAAEFGLDVMEAPDTGALAWFQLNARRTGHLRLASRIVTCVHSPSEWIARWNRSPLTGPRDAALAAMERDQCRWSDGVVAPSSVMADWVSTNWGVERSAIRVIPYPLGDLEGVAKAAVQAATPATEPGRLLFAGRLEPRKGIDTLLEGFAAAVEAGADLTLDLAGEDMPDPSGTGRHGALLLDRLPAPVRARVRVHGRLAEPELSELRARASAIAIPSPMDNYPNTCMEGMAEGRIVVAARAGGMAEIVRHDQDGLLFEAGDGAGLGAALVRIGRMSEAERAALGRSAAARILDLCGNRRIVQERIEHYKSVQSPARPSSKRTKYVILGSRRGASRTHVAELESSARAAGAAFASGWSVLPDGRVRAYGPPGIPGQDWTDAGPFVVERSAAGRLPASCGVAEAVRQLHGSGSEGVVVPEVLIPPPPASQGLARRIVRRALRVIGRD